MKPHSKVGRWWYGEEEVDIVGLAPDDDRILLADCKWTSNPVGHSLVESLQAKTEHVRWGPSDRREER